MKHHSLAMDFSSLDFEKIDTEILEDETKELEEAEPGAMERDPTMNKAIEGKDVDGSTAPSSWLLYPILFIIYIYIYIY